MGMTRRRRPSYGINAGHGYVKVVLITDNHEPAVLTLPALISQALQQLVGAIRRVQSVAFGNGNWWVGDDALIGQGSPTALNVTTDEAKLPTCVPRRPPRGPSIDARCTSIIRSSGTMDTSSNGAADAWLRASERSGYPCPRAGTRPEPPVRFCVACRSPPRLLRLATVWDKLAQPI